MGKRPWQTFLGLRLSQERLRPVVDGSQAGRDRTVKRLLVLACTIVSAQSWSAQTSGVTVSLRGITAVNSTEAWASGAKGTLLHTMNSGKTWSLVPMTGVADLDFRDIEAVNERTVFLMSAGPGQLSRVYKTSNAGERWELMATNLEPK